MDQFTPAMGAWITIVGFAALIAYLWWFTRCNNYLAEVKDESPVCPIHNEGNFFGSCEECLRLIYGDDTINFQFLKPCPACRTVAPHEFWMINEDSPILRTVVDRRCAACNYVWTEK
jgi:hypothetical protein